MGAWLVLSLAFQTAGFVVPPLGAHVNDAAQLLSAQERRFLEQTLNDFQQKTQNQFIVLIVPSLNDASLEEASLQVSEAWKIGKKGNDNGLLLFIALEERKIRIEVGYGLEGVIPDAIAARVIQDVLTPYFKKQDYARGISAALATLIKNAAPDYQSNLQSAGDETRKRKKSSSWFVLLWPLLWFLWLTLGKRRRHFGIGGFPLAGSGLGGGSLFGGGGGFSGGGGRFGGGGASGGW